MIDALDTQTQTLPLDEQQAKPKRGRPSTGKALSNADRQRAYRERQKSQRNEKPVEHEVPYEEVVAIAQELGERCKKAEEEVARWKKLAGMAERARQNLAEELTKRNDNPARKKRHRDEPAAQLTEDKTYTLQARTGSGKWMNLVAGIYGEEASRQLDRVIDNKLLGTAKNRQYRLVEDEYA